MAENPQDQLGSSTEAETAEQCEETGTGDAETMAEMAAPTDQPPITAAARATRRAEKQQAQASSVPDERDEMSKRAKIAATEYYMTQGDDGALGIAELARKHGIPNCNTLRRTIARMQDQACAFTLAREYRHSEVVRAAVGEENPTQTPESAVAIEIYRDSGQPFEVYSEAMVHAATLVKEKGWNPAAAAANAHQKFLIQLSSLTGAAVRKHVQRHGTSGLKRQGRRLKVDEDAESQLVDVILLMRKARLPTWRSIMKKICKGLMEGTPYARMFPDGEPGDRWWQRFVKRHSDKLRASAGRKHELQRERWTNSKNLETFYTNLENLLLDLGIAVLNPEYDANARWRKSASKDENERACRIIIVRKNRVCSVDETEATTNMSGGSTMGRTSSEKILIANDGIDHGEVNSNKTSQRVTMYGGSFCDGHSLRQFVIFNCNPKVSWMMGAPRSSILNEHTHKRHRCAYGANESGGSTAEMFLRWLKAQFGPTVDENGNPKGDAGPLFHATKDDPVVILLDGHGSHWSLDVLQYCVDNGIHLVLRPPHTSHVSQGEDVINFLKLKNGIRKACGELLAIRAVQTLRDNALGTPDAVSLSNADLMQCVKVPWEDAFSESNCRKAWAKTGFEPFTRRVYWELYDHEQAKLEQSRLTESSTGLNLQNFTLNSLGPAGGKTAGRQELEEYLADDLEGLDDGERDQVVQELSEKRVPLNSSRLWAEPGGATGESALKMVQADAAERQARKDAAVARKQAQEEKDRLRRQNAAPIVETAKNIVRDKGWGTGGHGKLTVQMVKDVLFVYNKPAKSGEKTADLIALMKQQLSWDEEKGCFAGDDVPGPAPPPAAPNPPPE